jgi:hypothetical protein
MKMNLRPNDDLDAILGDVPPINGPLPRAKAKRRKPTLDPDQVRRRAFRLLALIADLSAGDRLRVIRAAERLNLS